MAMYITGRAIEVFAWGKLYRTSLFEDIRFLLGRYHEDAYTTYKLVHKANKVVNTIMIGYAYRNNSYSIMNAGFTLKQLDSIYVKLEQSIFIKTNYPELKRMLIIR